MNSYHRFFVLFFLFLVIISVACAVFNLGIDPYGIWGHSSIVGVNHIKNEQKGYERLFKAVYVMRVQPKVVFLGSSRMRNGVNPGHVIGMRPFDWNNESMN